MTWFDISLFVVPALLAISIGVIASLVLRALRRKREREERTRAFQQIGEALERDIAAAEARGVKVERVQMTPSHRRIKF